MADPLMPAEILDWMEQRDWGRHHLQWHVERQWDLLTPLLQAWATQQGWQRAGKQEGTAGNGFDFLAMHRAMMELLRDNFAAHTSLFAGWPSPPTDPNDPQDPKPDNGRPDAFSADMQQAIQRLESNLGSFSSEDELGLFIETRLRPVPGIPGAVSEDPSAGIHNYLHGRFSDSNSPIDMGDPQVNLANARFWRLHGWIDARWTAYRQFRGLSDQDPAFRAVIDAEKHHMDSVAHPVHGALAALRRSRRLRRAAVPRSLAKPFVDTPTKRFVTMMSAGPPTTLNELRDRIQLALELEHFTIPPYLCAVWSVKAGGHGHLEEIFRGVVIQEMLHMGLCCNLLVAIGAVPQINTPNSIPEYPDYPPGVDLSEPVSLRPLSKALVQQFLEVEHPQHPPIPIPTLAAGPTFPTIGDLYDSILEGLRNLNPTFTLNGQLDSSFSTGDELLKIGSLAEAEQAIRLIKEQGEGTTTTPAGGPGLDDLAHYYRLQQIVDEVQYVRQADGTFRKDPSRPLPFPPPQDIFAMAPVPPGGYPAVPAAENFDRLYTAVLDDLQAAWAGGDQAALDSAIVKMFRLKSPARLLMNTPRDPIFGPGNYGPTFRLRRVAPVPAAGLFVAASGARRLLSAAAASSPGFNRIREILDDAVQGQQIGAHGAFWRGITRDQFVAKSIFGRKLIFQRPDGTFDPDQSNLVRALEGSAPFGADLVPPPAGAIFNRMPDGFSPVSQSQIDEIRAWISAGCPDQPVSLLGWIDPTGGGPVDAAVHLGFWREFDDWAMFHAVSPVPEDLDTFFSVAPLWMAFARDPQQESQWNVALADTQVRQAVGRLEARQRDTVTNHYGKPVPLLTLLDSFQRFGDNSFPDDSLRPQDLRHNMNGASMWFFWAAFTDACLRIQEGIPPEFWLGMGRVVLVGLINDGLFRQRFSVQGFTADAAGQVAVREFAAGLGDAEVGSELCKRFREANLP